MKALTLTQPWATLVAIGAKQYETRSWSTAYRGPLAIHAAKGWKRDDWELCEEEPFAAILSASRRYPKAIYEPKEDRKLLPLGVIVATAQLVACVRTEDFGSVPDPERSFGNYEPGRFVWVLENVQRIEGPLVKGSLGLWEWRTAPAN